MYRVAGAMAQCMSMAWRRTLLRHLDLAGNRIASLVSEHKEPA